MTHRFTPDELARPMLRHILLGLGMGLLTSAAAVLFLESLLHKLVASWMTLLGQLVLLASG